MWLTSLRIFETIYFDAEKWWTHTQFCQRWFWESFWGQAGNGFTVSKTLHFRSCRLFDECFHSRRIQKVISKSSWHKMPQFFSNRCADVLACAVAWGLNTFAWVVSTGVSALVPPDVSWKTGRELPRLDLCLLVGNCPPLRHWNQPLRQWLCSGAWMTSKGQTCLSVHSLSVHSWKSFVLELRFAPLQCSSVCSVLVVRRDEIIDWIFRCIFVFQPASNWLAMGDGVMWCRGWWRCRDSKTAGGFGPNVGHDADITATHYAWLPSGCGCRVGLGLQLG